MAQYTTNDYTMAEDSCMIITINHSNKKQQVRWKNLLPASRPLGLHKIMTETRCQTRVLPPIIYHPCLTARGTCVWLSTQSHTTFESQLATSSSWSGIRETRNEHILLTKSDDVAVSEGRIRIRSYDQTCEKRTNDLKRTLNETLDCIHFCSKCRIVHSWCQAYISRLHFQRGNLSSPTTTSQKPTVSVCSSDWKQTHVDRSFNVMLFQKHIFAFLHRGPQFHVVHPQCKLFSSH